MQWSDVKVTIGETSMSKMKLIEDSVPVFEGVSGELRSAPVFEGVSGELRCTCNGPDADRFMLEIGRWVAARWWQINAVAARRTGLFDWARVFEEAAHQVRLGGVSRLDELPGIVGEAQERDGLNPLIRTAP